MSENNISARIRNLRAKHGLTLEQVAQQVGVGRSTVRKWETGIIENMRRDKIAKLAAALHTTPGYLMGWTDSEESALPSSLPPTATIADSPTLNAIDWDLSEYIPNNLFRPLRLLRKARGLSTDAVADAIGIPTSSYEAIENGSNTDCITLARIATFYCCSTDFALSFDGVFAKDANSNFAKSKLLRLHQSFSKLTSDDQEDVIAFAQSLLDSRRPALRMVGRDGSREERYLSQSNADQLTLQFDAAPKVPDDL